MFIVMGATGHVGAAVADTLLNDGHPVIVVTRDTARAAAWAARGATVAAVDIHDADALRDVFSAGSRAFVLNPPADPSTDTDHEERRTAGAIVAALETSGLEKVVVASTYGAQAGERIGDLSTLYELEQAMERTDVPAAINRGAYYYTNWDTSLDSARDHGTITSMLPADLLLPMVAPADLGVAAARRHTEPPTSTGVHYVEGPHRYTADDVAAAFSRALDKPIRVEVIPPDERRATFETMGFSTAAAESYSRMVDTTAQGPELPDNPERGTIDIDTYVTRLVDREQPAR